ncbi:TetR/AcrR family transcriptional regulator [Pseudonocardiaceae bacterium YIM PH 21723]|nr:TetR/AcrR family transcriptional regulator [Pseudonocardiaceae bacterium YIM PH 21723]
MGDVKSRRERYAEMTRAAVLDNARRLFAERGFDATSVDDIAQATEISKGGVYHHFADKKELFAELFADVLRTSMKTVLTAIADMDTDLERAVEGGRAFLRGITADHIALALFATANSVLGVERVRKIDEDTVLPLVRALMQGLRDTGQIRDVPIDATARLIFALMCEATVYIAEQGNDELARQDMDAAMAAFLRGLARPA